MFGAVSPNCSEPNIQSGLSTEPDVWQELTEVFRAQRLVNGAGDGSPNSSNVGIECEITEALGH